MEAQNDNWYFTTEQLAKTPSRNTGIDADKELSYRQQAANFIQDLGQRLDVSQLCINTAIVYMHRFYMYHSLSHFHRYSLSQAALFLAAKMEEEPRKMEHVIKVSYLCLHKVPLTDIKGDTYYTLANDLVTNENLILQTLGFEIQIDHPHTHVVRCCQRVHASKDLSQTSYIMASNSLHMTTMCLQYKPTVVACFCVHLACKWSNWEIPQSSEGKTWYWYVDNSVTLEILHQLIDEFLEIFDKSPSRLKKNIMRINAQHNQQPAILHEQDQNKSLTSPPTWTPVKKQENNEPSTSTPTESPLQNIDTRQPSTRLSLDKYATNPSSVSRSSRPSLPKHEDKHNEVSSSRPTPPFDLREDKKRQERESNEYNGSKSSTSSSASSSTDAAKYSSRHKQILDSSVQNKQSHSSRSSQHRYSHHRRQDAKHIPSNQDGKQDVSSTSRRHSTSYHSRDERRDSNREQKRQRVLKDISEEKRC